MRNATGKAHMPRPYTCTCGRANEHGTCRRCQDQYRKATNPREITDCQICRLALRHHLRCAVCTVLVGPLHASKMLIGDLCRACYSWRLRHATTRQETIYNLDIWADTPDGFERHGFVVRKSPTKPELAR